MVHELAVDRVKEFNPSLEDMDPYLEPWAKKHGFKILTEWKDWQLRILFKGEFKDREGSITVRPRNQASLYPDACTIIAAKGNYYEQQTFRDLKDLPGLLDWAANLIRNPL